MFSKLQHLDRRYAMLALFALLSLIVCLGYCRKLTLDARHRAETSRHIFTLIANQTTTNQIASGETHAYTISLASHQYLRLAINRPQVSLTVRLTEPGDQLPVEHTIRCYGILPLSLISRTSGIFTLEIRTAQAQEGAAPYELIVERLREASLQDEDRVLADKAFALAEGLRQQWQQESFADSLSQYTKALQYWYALNDQHNLAIALLSIAELNYISGKNKDALDYYTRAFVLSRNSQQPEAETEALNGMSIACIEMGNNAAALQHCTLARDLSRNAGDWRGEAQALNYIGLIHYLSGELTQAVDYFEQALGIGQSSADPKSQAQTLLNLGYAYQDLGDLQRASNCYSQAHILWQSLDDRRQIAAVLTATGNIYTFLGERQESLKRQKQAASLLQQIGDLNGEAAALNGLGNVYDALGEPAKALAAYERSLHLSELSGNRVFAGQTLGYIGRVHHTLGNIPKAVESFKQKLHIARQTKDPRTEAHTLRDIGSILHSLGRQRDALQKYEQALALNRKVSDRRGQAYTLDYIGYIHDTAGRKRQALVYYSQALSLMQSVEDSSGEIFTLYNIARTNCDMGNLSEAHLKIEEALKKIESQRTKVISQELRTSYFASVQEYYKLYINILMRLHQRDTNQGLNARAMEISEKARARVLIDSLIEAGTDIRQGVEPKLLEKERNLEQMLNTRIERRIRMLSSNKTSAQIEQLESEINQLTDEVKEIQVQIKDSSPRYAALTQPVPLSVSEIQTQLLDSDTVMLEYSLGEQASYLWAVTPDTIESYQLPARNIIEDLSGKVYELLTAQQALPGETSKQYLKRVTALESQYWSVATRLSQMLLAPVAAQIGKKRLVIVADEALQYIPFSSLPMPKPIGSTNLSVSEKTSQIIPLIVEHEIVCLPSASTLEVLRQEHSKREPGSNMIAIFADPIFTQDDPRATHLVNPNPASIARSEPSTDLNRTLRDIGSTQDGISLPRLLATRAEADSIVEAAAGTQTLVALDFDANLAKVQSPEIAQCRILHLATHGILNNEHPELSGIVLSLINKQGEACDGFLALNVVCDLKLKADLVVLSACNTGLGKKIRGEGLIGMTRGFMYAGAPRVVASLWQVNDVATARLMSLFYRGMLKKGLQPAAALRAAQIEMWKNDRWKSPFFWAAFHLQGEWRAGA
jgi:CHAT domain-containing protein/tetratricopeptide (TPR) repeat protein